MTLQLRSTFDPWHSYRSRWRALRVGWYHVWQITFEFTKNMPLCSHADIIIFLPEVCCNSRLLPAEGWLPERTLWSPCLCPFHSFVLVLLLARFCLVSLTPSAPPPRSAPHPHPSSCSSILYSTDRHARETIFHLPQSQERYFEF